MTSEARPPEAGDRRWRDGSEDVVVEILRTATDRSSASDELAAHIVDWPTRYHFGRARTNLLHPLDLGPGLRVLDVGAGTGVMSRFAAERGASVVAVEGDTRRAEAAALRCSDPYLDLDVDVRHGSVDDLDDADGPFDVVLCIGVLEYAGDDPAGFLTRLAGHLAPAGVLAVAIENRFGLAYWLGADEDHLGRPWVGLEGYPASTATATTTTVRTHGRRGLADLLAGAGLGSQRWLAPSPDYKLPTAILTERIHDEPDAVDLVDQLVGPPLDRSRMGGTFEGDERAVHRGMLEAGLGLDLANSFLVVAGADVDAVDRRCDPSVLAWRFTGDRSRSSLRVRTIRTAGSDPDHRRWVDRRPTHRSPDPAPTPSPTGWLQLDTAGGPPEPWITGPNLEQVALARLRAGDRNGLAEVLGHWGSFAGSRASERDVTMSDAHPFLPAGSRRVLPGDHLDLGLDNLAGAGDDCLSGLVFIDDEWTAATGVDLELVAIRACWKLASVAIGSGTRHPWPTTTTVDDLAVAFCGLLSDGGVDVTIGPDPLDRLHLAESELRVVALGGTAVHHVAQLRAAGRQSLADRTTGTGPSTGLRGRLANARRIPVIGDLLAAAARFIRRFG
jgi:2-polyprenyl-3-methyl-5-hydroxy-6-metoxy-1,4-benzoquinol methylase